MIIWFSVWISFLCIFRLLSRNISFRKLHFGSSLISDSKSGFKIESIYAGVNNDKKYLFFLENFCPFPSRLNSGMAWSIMIISRPILLIVRSDERIRCAKFQFNRIQLWIVIVLQCIHRWSAQRKAMVHLDQLIAEKTIGYRFWIVVDRCFDIFLLSFRWKIIRLLWDSNRTTGDRHMKRWRPFQCLFFIT